MYSLTGNHNGLMEGGKSNVASVRSNKTENGDIVISRQEFVSSINSNGSDGFVNMTFSINPALRAVFGWLSQVAGDYSEYQLTQLGFVYKPVVSAMSVSSVGSLGTLVMAHNPNAGEDGYSSFEEIINAANSIECNIAEHMTCWVECDSSKVAHPWLYTRSGPVPANQDVKTYDHGKLNFAMFGVPTAYTSGTQLGLLYINYKVILRKPRMFSALGNGIQTDLFLSTAGETAALPFGTSHKYSNSNSIGGALSIATDSIYTFPDDFEGIVEVMFVPAGVDVVGIQGDIAPAGQVEAYNSYMSTGGLNRNNVVSTGSDSTVQCIVRWFKVSTTSQVGQNTLTFTVDSATSISASRLTVSQVNPLLTDFANDHTTVA
jgi:hypothetical protein